MIERSYMVESYTLWQPQLLIETPGQVDQSTPVISDVANPTTPEDTISVVTHFLSKAYGRNLSLPDSTLLLNRGKTAKYSVNRRIA